jgi:hypothetical protein
MFQDSGNKLHHHKIIPVISFLCYCLSEEISFIDFVIIFLVNIGKL